jgi:hypothetical protein
MIWIFSLSLILGMALFKIGTASMALSLLKPALVGVALLAAASLVAFLWASRSRLSMP